MKQTATILLLVVLTVGSATAQYALQFGASIAAHNNQLLVGEGRNLLLPGSVYVFDMATDGTWEQTGTLVPTSDDNQPRGFGRALSVSGNTLAVGAPLAGEVQLFVRDGNTWSHATTLESDTYHFGTAVALHGDHLLVGASGTDQKSGSVYAYQRTAEGAWKPAGNLAVDEDMTTNDRYGEIIALHGDNAVVCTPGMANRTGKAYTFHYHTDSGQWMENGSVAPPNADTEQRFGDACLFVENKLAVSSPADQAGSVSFFTQGNMDKWSFSHQIKPDDPEEGENFGASLSYANGRLWVGAPRHAKRQGAVYLFSLDTSGRPTSSQRMVPDNLQFRSSFGSTITTNSQVTAIGAVGHDNFEGAVFPYGASDQWQPPLYNDSSEMTSIMGSMVECEEGSAAAFPCKNVDMISFLTRREIGARRGIQVNDVWGWEDSETGHEYALVGRTDGTSFIDLTNPAMPLYLGNLPKTATANQSLWRDIKVYKDHAFIVADGAGAHHMQVFDLRQLRDVKNPPMEFTETTLYKGIYSSHNIIINEETGYAYAVGNDSGGETCGGALHMINIQNPTDPVFAGCFADTRTGRGTGATHDAQCVTYIGPDAEYRGREICLSSNGTALSIADVTNKESPVAISIAEYPNVAYTHQGWLTEDHRYFYLNDEGDEMSELVDATRTLIFDLTDLDDPAMVNEYMGPSSAIDHNLYIRGNTMYQTNYVEGLRLVDITDPENPTEVGHFDTVPYGPNDNSPVLGAWSNYPFFKSGVIVVTSGREGVFFLKKKSVDI